MTVQHNLVRIMELADRMARECTFGAHDIYVLARDGLDTINAVKIADATTTFPPGSVVFRNTIITAESLQCLREDKKINAIKILRTSANLGLKEAKDLIEAYMHEVLGAPLPTWMIQEPANAA